MSKAVVIGAGLSGAASAILLARAGHAVTLVEKSPFILPTVRGFSRGGLRFDTGFHYAGGLDKGLCLWAYLNHLGVAQDLRPIPLDPGGFDRVLIQDPGLEFRYCQGEEELAQRLEAAFPKEKNAIRAYLAEVRRACAETPLLNLDLPPGDLRDIRNIKSVSLGSFLSGLTSDPLLKAVLSVHCLLYGSPPEQAPLHVHAYVAGSLLGGVCALEGGGTSLARAFERGLERAGVRVVAGTGAAALKAGPAGHMASVRLENNEELDAEVCVCTTHPAVLARLAPAGMFRPVYARRLAELRDTPSADILFGAIAPGSNLLKGHNAFILPNQDVDALFEAKADLPHRGLFAASTQGDDPRTLSLISLTDFNAVSAWKDSAPGRRGPGYAEHKSRVLARAEACFAEAMPEAAEVFEAREGSTPLSLRRWLNQPRGAMYGTMHRMDQYDPLPLTKCRGLFVAGQAIISPGLLGAVISAYLTCEIILGQGQLGREVRQWA